MLLGSAEDLPPGLARLSTFGLLREETADTVRDWIHASVSAGLIAVSNDQYRTLSLTERGREFMHSRLPDAAIRRPSRPSSSARLRGIRYDRLHPLKAHPMRGTRGVRSRR
jgi:superfamily II DNA helicase RecQ